MKKTVNINLNRIAFIMNEEAHKQLEEYLKSIELHYSSDEDCKEIMQDIEARIQELLSEKLHDGKMIIEEVDIQEIIKIMGHPSQFEDDGSEKSEQDSTTNNSKAYMHFNKWRKRRFYRDPQNVIVSGVCSGIAAYFAIDPTLVRLLVIILTIISGIAPVIVVGYLILSAILPKAITAAQRLEMQGEVPTIENIKLYLAGEKFRIQKRKTQTILGKLFSLILKIFFITITSIMVILIFLFAILVILGIFSIGTNVLFTPQLMAIPFIALGLFLAIIPIYAIIKLIVKTFNNTVRSTPRLDWTLGILWFVALFSLISISVVSVNWNASHEKMINLTHSSFYNISGKTYQTINWEEGKQTKLEGFNAISVSNNIEAEIIPSDAYTIEVFGKKPVQDKILYKIKDSTLYVSRPNGINLKTIHIKLFMPDYKRLVSKSGATIRATEINNRENVELISNSGANIMAIINGENIMARTKSAGKITLQGTSNTATFNTTSGSSIEAIECIIQTLDATASSGSEIECYFNISGHLKANSGSDIDYSAPKEAKVILKEKSGGDIDRD
ncbi:DUF2807 domain-containing protein [Gammaproteobacteria bacterium]|nr:DUF2807 domain-containing protein [Gammaproteobacteria bacterium]